MPKDTNGHERRDRLAKRRAAREKKGPPIVVNLTPAEVMGWFDEGLSDREIIDRIDARCSYELGDKLAANVAEKVLEAVDGPIVATLVAVLRGLWSRRGAAPGHGVLVDVGERR